MSRFGIRMAMFGVALALPAPVRGQSGQVNGPGSSASADTSVSASSAPTRGPVGWEFGQAVYGQRAGELALYVGASQGNSLIAFRLGVLNETDQLPCSVGVMYQYIWNGNVRTRIRPTGSVSLGRVFSCAASDDPRQGSPSATGTATLSGGVRIEMFSGSHMAGSLDVMGFVERMSGVAEPADRTLKGVMVGIALHSPRPLGDSRESLCMTPDYRLSTI